MKIDAQLLWQAVKNVSVFSRKDGWAGGVHVERHHDGTLRFRTSDDFVGIESRIHVGTESQVQPFYLYHESVKELEKSLRDKKGELHISIGGADGVLTVGSEFSTKTMGCPDEGWWNMFTYVMDHVYAFPQSAHDWSLDPQRLSKMNLLEPKAEYPLSLGHCDLGGDQYIAFKYGPSTHGMIKPLNREKLKEAYGDKLSEVVW